MATYSKGAINEASTFLYAKDEAKDKNNTVPAQIAMYKTSMNVGETVARSKKSKDILPVELKPPLQLNASKGNAEKK